MALRNVVSTVFKLRRDTAANYEQVKDTFIPEYGEPVVIDTGNGLRFKIGDGINTYANLDYVDRIVYRGYYNRIKDKFYADQQYITELPSVENKLYYALDTLSIYIFDGTTFLTTSSASVDPATDTKAGIMKLYNITGSNVDGTMTQKAITDELNQKFEVEVDGEEETIIFENGINR